MPLAVPLGPATVAFSVRDDGDFGPAAGAATAGSELARRQRAVVDLPWHTARQVHGRAVHVVDGPASPMPPGVEADALVTAAGGVALAVRTADCAPVALVSREGVIGMAHAGWRGLVEGVLTATLAAMRRLGATRVDAALGACIGPECYAFSPADLDEVARRLGSHVRAATADGRPALDLPGAVRAALEAEGIDLRYEVGSCTACDAGRWFSHRARAEAERQATAVWRP